MKAPVREANRTPSQTKKRMRAHAALLYKAHKQIAVTGMRNPDFLTSRLRFPRPVLLRLVSSEASRLSRTNRWKTITLQEIDAAVALVKERIHARPAA